MKAALLLCAAALSLAGCQKSAVDPEQVPADTVAEYGQNFQLYYQQRAELSGAGLPALTLHMTDLTYSYCPQDVNCFVASAAWPTLRCTDAQGQATQLKLPVNPNAAFTLGLLDTTSFVSSGRRYGLAYIRWDPGRPLRSQEMPRRSDFGLWLRVTTGAR